MLRKIGAAIRRGLFWTYERGTWQYDVMVALILAFIFFTPRGFFQDQPVAAGVVLLSSGPPKVYQLRAGLVEQNTGTMEQSAMRVLEQYTGRPVQIRQIKPETDSHGQVVSYAVWVEE